jgi:phosphate-selective porin OprO/OprP
MIVAMFEFNGRVSRTLTGLIAGVLCISLLFPGLLEGATIEELERRIEQLEEQNQNQSDGSLSPYIQEIGGRMQVDFTFNTDDSDSLVGTVGNGNGLEDGSEFRRMRFFFAGELNPAVGYKFQADVSNGDLSVLDAYINFRDLPYAGDITVGRFNESFTLHENVSSKYITLMTRSMLSDIFQTGWNNGVQWSQHYADNRLNLTLAGYLSNDGNGESPNATGGKYNVTGRVTSPLIYEENGRRVLHLGAGYSHRQPGNADAPDTDTYSASVTPEVHQTDNFMSVTIPDVESYGVYSGELAGVYGPLSFQAEYAQQTFDRTSGAEPDFDAYYGQVSYLLTGEHRPYSRSGGSFGRIRPDDPFLGASRTGENGGIGAWELAARVSNLDLTEARNVPESDDNEASELDVATVGLNWYPNAHTRWALNVVDADQEALGDARYVTTRFQIDF